MTIRKKLTKSVLIIFCFLFLFSLFSCFNNSSIPTPKPTPDIRNTAFVVLPDKQRVDVINTDINEAFDSLFTEEKPSSIAISPNEKLILVTNSGSGTVSAFFRKPNDTFQKLNSVGSGKNPQGIVFNPVFPEAYVAYEDDGKILVLDTKNTNISPTVISSIDIKGSTPKKMVTNKDGTKLFVTDSANGKLLVFAKTKNELIKKTEEISLIENSKDGYSDIFEGIGIDSSEKIYISDYQRDNLIVVNGKKTNEKIQYINLKLPNNNLKNVSNIGPKNMVIYKILDGKEKIYVVGYNASIVSSIDIKTSKVVNISLTSSKGFQGNALRDSYNPVGATFANFNDKDFIYVTNTSGLPLSMIDPETDRLQRYTTTTLSMPEQGYGEIISCCKYIKF